MGRRRSRSRSPPSRRYRSRSRSPRGNRSRYSRTSPRRRSPPRRSRSRSRDDRRSRHSSRRSRSRSARRSRSRSPPRYSRSRSKERDLTEGQGVQAYRSKLLEEDGKPAEALKKLEELSEEEQMKRLLGFGGFDSTKGSLVMDNVVGPAAGAVQKKGKREYRQYMNRRTGFNNDGTGK